MTEATEGIPLRDWRGVDIIPGDTVIYTQSNGSITEAIVATNEPDQMGRILVEVVRRNNADATFRRVMPEVKVRPASLTVVALLPPAILPTIQSQAAIGEGISYSRRVAMKATGGYMRGRRRR